MAIRIVMDEAHQILTTQEYRSLFAKLQALAGFPIAKMLLTASLPKRLEADFLRAFGLPLSTKILRAPSEQPHISYHQVKYSSMNTKSIRLAIDIARFMNTVMEHDQIGIIFCTTKKEVDQLESFTSCSSYSGHPEKGHNEQAWKAGHKRWIAATTGLIQGIDAPNVGVTLFLGVPYGLINLYQGSGRGGRDGRKSWSITLIQSNNHFMVDGLKDSNDPSCVKEGDLWQRTQQCRRLGFSKTLDDSEVKCQDLANCHLCDFCDIDSAITKHIAILVPDPNPSETLAPIVLSKEEEDMFDSFDPIAWDKVPDTTQLKSNPAPSHLEYKAGSMSSIAIRRDAMLYHQQIDVKKEKAKKINQLADILKNKCPICWAYNSSNLQPCHAQSELFRRCNNNSKEFIPYLYGWIDFKKKMVFQKYEYCYKCHFPQAPPYLPQCHPPVGGSQNARNLCPLTDCIILLVWFIRHSDRWWPQAVANFPGLAFEMGPDAFAGWLNLGHSISHFYNGLELVLWFYELHNVS